MRITILGSGTGVPTPERAHPSILVEIGSCKLLLDSGSGTLRRLLKAGTEYYQIDILFYSHFHPDHIADLVPLLFALRYWGLPQRPSPIHLVAGEGFSRLYLVLREAFGHWIEPPEGGLKLYELPSDTLTSLKIIPQVLLKTGPVKHNPESLAIRLEHKEKALVYSGDTDFSPELVSLARGADLLICECSTPEGMKISGHLVPSLAGRMAQEAKVKKLLLTHFYPPCEESNLVAACQKEFSGEILLAQDLATYEI
ncbi:MBL fold metallo-hydrolase [Thermosulfuriphilus sp.]